MGSICPRRVCSCMDDCCNEHSNIVNPQPSPMTAIRRAQVESENQLTAFQLGDQSQRRHSHPNQLKGLQEYELAKKGVPSNPETPPESPPTSPFMVWPVIPPGRLM